MPTTRPIVRTLFYASAANNYGIMLRPRKCCLSLRLSSVNAHFSRDAISVYSMERF